jgi:WD40 repeat protein
MQPHRQQPAGILGICGALRYSSDGRTLDTIVSLCEAENGPAIFLGFDARTGRRLVGPVPVNRRGWSPLMLTSDGRRMLAAGEGGIIVRDAANLRVLKSFTIRRRNSPGYSTAYALSSDDRTLAIGGEDGSVRLLDLRTGKVRTAADRHGAPIIHVRFTPNGRTVVSTGEDGDVVLWDVRQATTAGETLSGHAGAVGSAKITRDGRTLYTSSSDGTVFIWDLVGARRLGRPFRAGAGDLERPHLALSSDGRVIATGQDDGAISIVDARTLERRHTIRVVTTGQVLGIGFVPGSHLMVVGGPNGFLALVDTDHGQVVRRLRLTRAEWGEFLPNRQYDPAC